MSLIFGPVPSRRLGRSLGVDLVPFKTCSDDCIYCQLGRTTHRTVERKAWVPLEQVMAQLKPKLSSQPDYITLSGSGEPTLHAQIAELIARIKALTDVPVAVLTNGSLLWDEAVRTDLQDADLVVPSLDAGDEALFRSINRPHAGIRFDRMLQGLVDFRRQFRGQYWLEVFLLAGRNTAAAAIERLARCVRRINPDRVQLNTATRPTAERNAVAVDRSTLDELAAMFDPRAEVIADFRSVHQLSEFGAGRDAVLELLRRRPCSVGDVGAGLDMHRNEVVEYLAELEAEQLVEAVATADAFHYRATRRALSDVPQTEASRLVPWTKGWNYVPTPEGRDCRWRRRRPQGRFENHAADTRGPGHGRRER